MGTFTEIFLAELVADLPPVISYSPLVIPLSSGHTITLARRDLFDARFQVISEGGDGGEAAKLGPRLEFLNAPSDLVPGVYEGGLKTWECSLDLVNYLDGIEDVSVRGKRVLEVGCGTAVPSLFLLQNLFSSHPRDETESLETHIHFQDYNSAVLELATFPNIVLAWYFSSASESYRATVPATGTLANAHISFQGELPVTEHLTAAFLSSLKQQNIHLRFFASSWDSFDLHLSDAPYHIVLSSETIYRTESLPSLISLLRGACVPRESAVGEGDASSCQYLCLVAAKVLYFGVGGSVSEFIRTVEDDTAMNCRGRVEMVWRRDVGVRRSIMKIQWIA